MNSSKIDSIYIRYSTHDAFVLTTVSANMLKYSGKFYNVQTASQRRLLQLFANIPLSGFIPAFELRGLVWFGLSKYCCPDKQKNQVSLFLHHLIVQ